MYKLHKYLLHYNFFISLCAVALVYYFSMLAHRPVPGYIYTLTFFATLFSYNLFRSYQDLKDYFKSPNSLAFELVLYSLLLCIICYALLPARLKLFYIIPGLLALAYKFPLAGGKNLRTASFLKVFVIALVWVLVGAGALFYTQPDEGQLRDILPLVIAQFLFFIAITLPFDVFDVEKDHFKTFPKVFGTARSMGISILCLLGYFTIHVLYDNTPQEKGGHALAALATLLVLLSYKKIGKKPYRYYFVDGLIILQTFFIYLLH